MKNSHFKDNRAGDWKCSIVEIAQITSMWPFDSFLSFDISFVAQCVSGGQCYSIKINLIFLVIIRIEQLIIKQRKITTTSAIKIDIFGVPKIVQFLIFTRRCWHTLWRTRSGRQSRKFRQVQSYYVIIIYAKVKSLLREKKRSKDLPS